MEAYDRMRRTCRTAASWVERAYHIAAATKLAQAKDLEEEGWTLVGYEVGQMLWKVLAHADEMVPLLNDYEAEEIERFAKDLVSALRKRRLLATLENDSGRTEGEKAAVAAAVGRLKS